MVVVMGGWLVGDDNEQGERKWGLCVCEWAVRLAGLFRV